ncbi:TPA: hypothetical protein SE795_001775, partial [Campylobacter jejuni]|nr:hypothetical protein [Campylobacter jejuni]
RIFYEKDIKNEVNPSYMESFYGEQFIDKKINRTKWHELYQKSGLWWIGFGWCGMIDFSFLYKIRLRFINYIIFEDGYFGIMLYLKLHSIHMYKEKLYNYRVRDKSICNHNRTEHINLPNYVDKLYEMYQIDFKKDYDHLYFISEIITCSYLLNEMEYKFYNFKIIQDRIGALKNALFQCEKSTPKLFNLVPKFILIDFIDDLYNKALYGNPVRKIKEQLSYKLGTLFVMTCKSKNLIKIISLPILLTSVYINHKIIKKNSNMIKSNYFEEQEIIKIKNHLSYRVGYALVNHPITFLFKIYFIYRQWKRERV